MPLGGVLGWVNTLRSAAGTLEDLKEFAVAGIPESRMSPLWLAPLAAGAFLLLGMAFLGAQFLARKPVLEQLQGGAQAKPKRRGRRMVREAPPPDAAGLSLAAVAAGAFVVGLGAIHLAIESSEREIDRLYATTRVTMELTAKDSTELGADGGFLYRSTVDAVMDTGYLEGCYLEGASSGTIIPNADALLVHEVGKGRYIAANQLSSGLRCLFRSTSDGDVFFSEAGTGGNFDVVYADGWDQGLFAKDWAAENEGKDILESVIPIVVPAKYTEGENPSVFLGQRVLVLCRSKLQMCVIAGMYAKGAAGKTEERRIWARRSRPPWSRREIRWRCCK